MKKIIALGAVACVSGFLAITPPSQAHAASSCVNHCYSTIAKTGYTPGPTEAWTTLTTFCQSRENVPGAFVTNEIWAYAGNNYVEFGVVREPDAGVPLEHWFWARTNSGSQQQYNLNHGVAFGTAYNATIKWTGTAGDWEFYQGGAFFGVGAGSFPNGPITATAMGGEMSSYSTSSSQNSFGDGNAGRVQSGVFYDTWAGPYRNAHDVPPYNSLGGWGDTWINDNNPSASGAGGC